jgi:hypothetical protein
VFLDSLFTPQVRGTVDIHSRIHWDLNGDRIINDPPDADLSNDTGIIQRVVGFNTVYKTIVLIDSVPDYNQPPGTSLPSTIPGSFCAPMAAANILAYWDSKGLSQTQGIIAGMPGETLAEYIGWFFDTNNQGNPSAYNGTVLQAAAGTYVADQDSNLWHYIRWDNLHPFMAVAPGLPPGKKGYNWVITRDDQQGFPFYQNRIDLDYPLLLNFQHWNIHFNGTIFVDSTDQDTVYCYDWGAALQNAQLVDPRAPEESWQLAEDSSSIGHTVTGIGYTMDGGNYVVVHDNWSYTHQKICVPWQNWNSTILADPDLLSRIDDGDRYVIERFELQQNYPNPFNPITTIQFQIPNSEFVTLKICNILGEEVATLLNDKLKAGNYTYQFDGSQLASGIYLYWIEAGEFQQVRKMILLR